MGDHESMVVSHTVNVAESGTQAAVRWYEVRTVGAGAGGGVSPFTLFQSGTFSPSETNRFVPSIAMDVSGDIAMGYSISDETINPKIGFTGRLVGDPAGQMGTEEILFAGGGSQTGTGPYWGNFTAMTVDPTDGCTFWYTNQYYAEDGSFAWSTRLASLRYPSCTSGATGTLEGTVTDGVNPLPGVKVTANAAQTTTDASGHYQFNLPVGSYDMTATKYGYFPGSANAVQVTDGGDTVQDFQLQTAPSTLVNGTVKDAGGNWPLYAKIVISGPGFPGASLYTDPQTGYYETSLVTGIQYTFVITAVSAGYQAGGGVLDLSALGNRPDVVKNWLLSADTLACNAPGYTLDVSGYFTDFTGGIPGSWTIDNFSTDGGLPWTSLTGADPCGEFSGNLTGGDGEYALVNSNCDGLVTDDTDMTTPSVDLTSTTAPVVRFNSDYQDLDSIAAVDYSIDGGANWTNIFEKAGTSDRGPKTISLPIDAAGEADVKARFHFEGFWAWWWQVDNVLVGEASCVARPGGLVVGNVRDANSNQGINGATVTNLGTGDSAQTGASADPAQGDGFYVLFSPSGSQNFEASKANYASDQQSQVIVPNTTQRIDFALQSGNVSAAPTPLSARVDPGGSDDKTLTLTNTGGGDANFEIVEINAPLLNVTTHGFANKQAVDAALARLAMGPKGPVNGDARSTRGIPALPKPATPHKILAAGDVIASYPSGITYGWGIAASGPNIWISNLGVAGGDDHDYEYADGVQTGNAIDVSGAIDAWAGDGAFNQTTGMYWRVDVVNAGSSCIFEVDPVSQSVTGNTICPNTGQSERGLAYDPVSSSYYIGSWLDGTIKHFDASGNILDSAAVNLAVSGLAYNANTGHLFVIQNFQGGNDITVLDALNNYQVVGEFPILDNGSPAMTEFGQAGLEFDCLGNLWAIDQNTQTIYKVDAGESAGCSVDIPWFTPSPTEGTVAANGGTADVNGHFDGTGLLPGLRLAQIQVKTNTPAAVPNVAVTLVVRFLDVPDSNQFEAYIYGAAGAGIMFGGPPNCPAGILSFCPASPVTRADMAGYIFRAMHGKNTPPPVYRNAFADVSFNDYNAFYIQGIYDDGITAGCGSGNYCPNQPNTRAQMSVFVVKAVEGADFVPPPATGIFNDVPASDPFAPWIEYLYSQGITAGCGGGNFCPTANISNGQMAVFLVKAFNVPHL
jgi:hypothetical protein